MKKRQKKVILFNICKRKQYLHLFFYWLFLSSSSAYVQADTLVLIPGFLSQGADWRTNQVAAALEASGWVDGGNYRIIQNQLEQPTPLVRKPNKVFYSLDLPDKMPIAYQAQILGYYLEVIHKQRGEPLILAGHSAGGVVARYWLVASNQIPVTTLITIASPHLGTPLANLSRLLMDTPLLEMAEQLGFRQLSQAEGLYADLNEEKPGNFLHWLNRQAHPAIRYVSVVRDNQNDYAFDYVVPSFSQDMNQVAMLKGQSEYWQSHGEHMTNSEDGYLLSTIIEYAKKAH